MSNLEYNENGESMKKESILYVSCELGYSQQSKVHTVLMRLSFAKKPWQRFFF